MKTQSNESNVVLLTSFEKINPSDLKAGFAVYSDIERQVDSLREGVAPWVYSVAYHFFEKSGFIAQVAAEDFMKAMQKEVDFITSESAGGKRLTNSQAKLTGRSPLASAYRKLSNTLKFGGDLRTLTSVSACETFNKGENEKVKAKEAKEAVDLAIVNHCKANLLRDGSVTPDVDFETDEVAKLMLDEAVEEYKRSREQGEHLDVVDGNGETTPSIESAKEQDQFDEMGEKLATSLRELYSAKVPIMGEEMALKQVTDGFQSSLNKWLNSAANSLKQKLKQAS